MNISQKNKIDKMRASGETFAVIAVAVGVSENTVKSYWRRNNASNATNEKADTCPECGLSLIHLPHKRQKRFCSDKCRLAWWAKHPDELHRKAVYSFTCQNCGKSFSAYGNSKRKHCSRECAVRARRASDE